MKGDRPAITGVVAPSKPPSSGLGIPITRLRIHSRGPSPSQGTTPPSSEARIRRGTAPGEETEAGPLTPCSPVTTTAEKRRGDHQNGSILGDLVLINADLAGFKPPLQPHHGERREESTDDHHMLHKSSGRLQTSGITPNSPKAILDRSLHLKLQRTRGDRPPLPPLIRPARPPEEEGRGSGAAVETQEKEGREFFVTSESLFPET